MSTKLTYLDQTANKLHVSGAMDIYSAAELRDALRQEIQARPELTVDLSQVQTCDTAGVQVLCSAMRTAREEGRTFRVSCASEAVERLSAAIGLRLMEL